MNAPTPFCWPPFPAPPGDCGCGGSFSGAMDCWQQISNFKAFLTQVLSEMGPIPLTGVVDGSNAAPGDVGEYITGVSQVPYAASPAVTVVFVNPLVVPAGDWNLWAHMTCTTLVGGASFDLSPVPTGMSNGLDGLVWTDVNVGGSDNEGLVVGMMGRGNFTVATSLPFRVGINQSAGGLTAGTAVLQVEGRRMR